MLPPCHGDKAEKAHTEKCERAGLGHDTQTKRKVGVDVRPGTAVRSAVAAKTGPSDVALSIEILGTLIGTTQGECPVLPIDHIRHGKPVCSK